MMNKSDDLIPLSKALFEALYITHNNDNLGILAKSIAECLRSLGIPLCRLQLPISSFFGFKHPFYAGVILTWTEDNGVKAHFRERSNSLVSSTIEKLRASPYASLIFDGEPFVHYTPSPDHSIKLISELYHDGFTDYFALSILLPDGARQVMSLATKVTDGFPANTQERLATMSPLLAMCIYGAYQSNAAKQIAVTYLGEYTGKRVLDGEFFRGNSEQMSTLILFADIRNFTALSERVGAKKVTEYVNIAFEKLSTSLRSLGAEILKFIGDAALIIFPDRHLSSNHDGSISNRNALDVKGILSQLVFTIQEIREIEIDGEKLIDLGVGLHMGDVYYGNIGAKDRLDFTVMGPAVNLASRLESLTKDLSASILFSESVYEQLTEKDRSELSIISYALQQVKGVSDQVQVWGVKV